MTVGELIRLLKEFPLELPVFFVTNDDERTAIAPVDAVMNLVHPERLEVMPDDESPAVDPDGYVDSLVVYSRIVRLDP